MNWRERITSDPAILGGKPAIAGTRISVELILELLGEGWSEKQLVDSYARLTPDDVNAVKALQAHSTGTK